MGTIAVLIVPEGEVAGFFGEFRSFSKIEKRGYECITTILDKFTVVSRFCFKERKE
jgi:hypothetical protein